MLNVSLLRWSQPTTDHIKRESLRYYQTRVHFWSRSVKRSLGFRFFGGSHIWTHLQSRSLPIGVRFHGLNWIRSTWKCRELCGLFKYRTSDRFVWRGESLGTVSCVTLPFVMECLAFLWYVAARILNTSTTGTLATIVLYFDVSRAASEQNTLCWTLSAALSFLRISEYGRTIRDDSRLPLTILSPLQWTLLPTFLAIERLEIH